MIKVYIFRNQKKDIYGFRVVNHGRELVCSAVSILTLNTVNSIEKFTSSKFECKYNSDGGFLQIIIPEIKNGGNNHDADILLKSFLLGVNGIKLEYPEDIKIFDEEVQQNVEN